MSGTRSFRLFVGNLPWTVSKKELSDYFRKFGYLKNVSVVFNPETGLSKGYGFVQFATKDGFTAAISQDNHILENSKLTIGEAGSHKADEEKAALGMENE